MNGERVLTLSREIVERQRARYQGYHIARERNDFDRKTGEELVDNARHYTNLPTEEQDWVRQQVERYLPFIMAQLDQRARNLVSLAEMRSFAESIPWRPPAGPKITATLDGKPIDPTPFLGQQVEYRAKPLTADRRRFIDVRMFDAL